MTVGGGPRGGPVGRARRVRRSTRDRRGRSDGRPDVRRRRGHGQEQAAGGAGQARRCPRHAGAVRERVGVRARPAVLALRRCPGRVSARVAIEQAAPRYDDDVRAELPHVLPSWPAAEDPAGAGEDRRYRTHHAVRQLLEVLAAGPPLVLLLDDLHWADSASIELLCALLRRPPVGPVLLGLALRPRQLSETLFVGLSRAVAEGVLTRIELAGLTLGESRQLLATDVDERRVPALHAESAGNPFLPRQLALFRGPTDPVDAADQPPDAVLPPAVSNALRAELALIDAATRGALQGAAVAGDPFVLDLAAVAAAVTEQAMTEALDELQLRDVVRPTTIPRRFQFRHPLLRRAIYESAPAAWRLGAHERCAESLAKRGVPVAARAHHVIASAREGDTAAVALLHDAGRAVATRAPAEAARWFSAALDLQPEPPLALELWRALADALGAAGMLADARAAAARALEMVPAEADDVRVRLVATVAGLDQTLGHHDDAHRRLVAALDSLPRLDGAEAVLLMGALALDRIFRTEFGRAAPRVVTPSPCRRPGEQAAARRVRHRTRPRRDLLRCHLRCDDSRRRGGGARRRLGRRGARRLHGSGDRPPRRRGDVSRPVPGRGPTCRAGARSRADGRIRPPPAHPVLDRPRAHRTRPATGGPRPYSTTPSRRPGRRIVSLCSAGCCLRGL